MMIQSFSTFSCLILHISLNMYLHADRPEAQNRDSRSDPTRNAKGRFTYFVLTNILVAFPAPRPHYTLHSFKRWLRQVGRGPT